MPPDGITAQLLVTATEGTSRIYALVWARTRSSHTRRPLIAGCGRMYSEDRQHPVSRAKKAIIEYKRTLADAEAELMVFYCEEAAGFCRDVRHHDTAYLEALVRMFGQSLKAMSDLNEKLQTRFLTRLDRVRTICSPTRL